MKWHWYYSLGISVSLVIAVWSYSLFGGATAVVSGHVTASRYQGSNWVCSGPWLLMVKSDQAFDQALFSACSKCDIPTGSQVFIGIATSQNPVSYGQPLRANATGLFKSYGTGYASWDGCP